MTESTIIINYCWSWLDAENPKTAHSGRSSRIRSSGLAREYKSTYYGSPSRITFLYFPPPLPRSFTQTTLSSLPYPIMFFEVTGPAPFARSLYTANLCRSLTDHTLCAHTARNP